MIIDPRHTHHYSIRDFFDYIPLSNRDEAPVRYTDDSSTRLDESLDHIVPIDSTKAYDMKDVIQRVYITIYIGFVVFGFLVYL